MLVIAIGDVHGCYDKLVDLLPRCREYAAGRDHRFVFVGDYIDRGSDSRAVVQHLIDLDRSSGQHVFLRGNHEDMLLHALLDPDAADSWLANGGDATLASYSVSSPDLIPSDHLDWLTTRPLTFDDGLRFFVHAGVNPARALDDQSPHDLLWIREPFLSSEKDFGRLIVHGHTPMRDGNPDTRTYRINIDTAAVYGGPLTAAVFVDDRDGPTQFIQAQGDTCRK
jgi:serine/threonine protein phosphatase 1